MSTRKIKRPIAQIAADLAVALERESADIIAIGGLLLEAKDTVDYGDWRAWLAANFGSSSRTADNYMSAARFSATCETVSQLKLRPTALYLLGSGDPLFSPEAIKAILKVAEGEWVNAKRAQGIAESLLSPPKIDDEDLEEKPLSDEEIEAILDGPPPVPPPPEPAPPPNASLSQFSKAVAMLAQVYTKPLASFVGTEHSPDQIRSLGDFLVAVADEITKRRAA